MKWLEASGLYACDCKFVIQSYVKWLMLILVTWWTTFVFMCKLKSDSLSCCHMSIYHSYSAVSAPKSDLTSFSPPPILINFFFVENLWSFSRPRVSLLTLLILLYDRRISPWIIYDWKTSAVSASPIIGEFFYALGGRKCRVTMVSFCFDRDWGEIKIPPEHVQNCCRTIKFLFNMLIKG